MMKFRYAAILVGFLAFVVNPGLGCSVEGEEADDDTFGFGGDEMTAAVVGQWRVTGDGISLRLALQAADAPSKAALGPSFVRSAMACGGRTFFRSAAACIDVSKLHVAGEVVEASGSLDRARVTGDFTIYGGQLAPGELYLSFPDGSRLKVPTVESTKHSYTGSWSRGNDRPITVTVERLSL
jgi:hypothetical protein